MKIDFQKYVSEYEKIIYSNFEYLIDRYFARKTSWIDTKFSMITGLDYPENDIVRGSGAIYLWIQGRGLESLVEFAQFIQTHNYNQNRQVNEKIRIILFEILDRLKTVRQKNRGHLFFCITPDGRPIEVSKDNSIQYKMVPENIPYNFSDLFGAKGMYSAAKFLDDKELLGNLKSYCFQIITAILKREFCSDQQCLDIKNPVQYISGRNSFGPYMIAIGLCELLYRFEKDSDFARLGFELIDYIVSSHINLSGKIKNLQEYDVLEFVDDSNVPYMHNQAILSDPGHSLEFIGLALKFLETSERGAGSSGKIDYLKDLLPKVLIQNFQNGFQEKPGGICKLYDLFSRKPYNSDMPWWSLPETIRAAWRCFRVTCNKDEQNQILEIIEKCHFCFMNYFVKPQLHHFAVQTRNENGEIADVIPAVPDIDPSYHTGLSLMDSINLINIIKKRI